MNIEFSTALQNFRRHGEVAGVAKDPLTEPEFIDSWADSEELSTRKLDNDIRDSNPLKGKIVRWGYGVATSANYEKHDDGYEFERIDYIYRRADVLWAKRSGEQLDFCVGVLRDNQSWLTCYHVDHLNPEKSFEQSV